MDPTTSALIGTLIRHALTAVGGYMVAHQWLDADQSQTLTTKIAGDAILALPIVWSALQKMPFEWSDLLGSKQLSGKLATLQSQVDANEKRLDQVFTALRFMPSIPAITQTGDIAGLPNA